MVGALASDFPEAVERILEGRLTGASKGLKTSATPVP